MSKWRLMAEIPKWLTPKQAAALLGVSTTWLYRARRGDYPGPPYYPLNHRYQYKEDEILMFIEMRRRECRLSDGRLSG